MAQRYRILFDEALQQAGPDKERIEVQRGELARRCAQLEKERNNMKNGRKMVRYVILAAVLAVVLSATALASANQEGPTRLWSGTSSHSWVNAGGEEENEVRFSDVVGLDLVDGRYLLTGDEAGTVVDITGRFSEDTAYVFTREKDPGHGGWSDLVVGGSPDNLGWAEVIYKADGSFGGVSGVWKGRPAWLESYYLTHGLERECDWIDWKDSN